MLTAAEQLDRQYLTMRERILSLAADFDRLQLLDGAEAIAGDARVGRLRDCLREVMSPEVNRAERVQMTLSDRSSDPRSSSEPA